MPPMPPVPSVLMRRRQRSSVGVPESGQQRLTPSSRRRLLAAVQTRSPTQSLLPLSSEQRSPSCWPWQPTMSAHKTAPEARPPRRSSVDQVFMAAVYQEAGLPSRTAGGKTGHSAALAVAGGANFPPRVRSVRRAGGAVRRWATRGAGKHQQVADRALNGEGERDVDERPSHDDQVDASEIDDPEIDFVRVAEHEAKDADHL